MTIRPERPVRQDSLTDHQRRSIKGREWNRMILDRLNER
jgi:hypothetical protein